MKIAVDAMGGDHAPQAIVEGINQACKMFPEIKFIIFGKSPDLEKYIDDYRNIEIVHTDEKINTEDEPVKSIRTKKKSSLVLAAKAVKTGIADAFISAGNTGAILAAGIFVIGRIKQVPRPALMTTLPTMTDVNGGFDMLDLGANADNEPVHLAQYAVMGSFYARNVRGVKNPRVAMLNNGTEDTKGSALTKAAFGLLRENKEINFIGNIEARDLLSGVADVVVTDGFTGNAVLKSIEGTALNLFSLLKESIVAQGTKGKIGGLLLKSGLKSIKNKLDYNQAGGAVLFGLKAPMIKAHGSASSTAICSTIAQIKTMVETNVVGQLVEYYANETLTIKNKEYN